MRLLYGVWSQVVEMWGLYDTRGTLDGLGWRLYSLWLLLCHGVVLRLLLRLSQAALFGATELLLLQV